MTQLPKLEYVRGLFLFLYFRISAKYQRNQYNANMSVTAVVIVV